MNSKKLGNIIIALFITALFIIVIMGFQSAFKSFDTSKCKYYEEQVKPRIIKCKEKLESTEFDLENYKVLLKQSRETVK